MLPDQIDNDDEQFNTSASAAGKQEQCSRQLNRRSSARFNASEQCACSSVSRIYEALQNKRMKCSQKLKTVAHRAISFPVVRDASFAQWRKAEQCGAGR